jgi:hypothetical protein
VLSILQYTNVPPPPFVRFAPQDSRSWFADTSTHTQNQTNLVFPNSTIRQTLHMSVGASQIRIAISNAFSPVALPITAVTVAYPTNGSAGVSTIVPGSVKALTFQGNASIVLPNGALAFSDPIDFPVAPQSMLTVTLYTAQGQASPSITSHPGSRTTSWFTCARCCCCRARRVS